MKRFGTPRPCGELNHGGTEITETGSSLCPLCLRGEISSAVFWMPAFAGMMTGAGTQDLTAEIAEKRGERRAHFPPRPPRFPPRPLRLRFFSAACAVGQVVTPRPCGELNRGGTEITETGSSLCPLCLRGEISSAVFWTPAFAGMTKGAGTRDLTAEPSEEARRTQRGVVLRALCAFLRVLCGYASSRPLAPSARSSRRDRAEN